MTKLLVPAICECGFSTMDAKAACDHAMKHKGVDMPITKGEWVIRKEHGSHDIGVMGGTKFFPIASIWLRYHESEANAHLIAAAVNACLKINPDNPMAVAESIGDLYEACKDVIRDCVVENGRVVERVAPFSAAILNAQQALAKVEGK